MQMQHMHTVGAGDEDRDEEQEGGAAGLPHAETFDAGAVSSLHAPGIFFPAPFTTSLCGTRRTSPAR